MTTLTQEALSKLIGKKLINEDEQIIGTISKVEIRDNSVLFNNDAHFVFETLPDFIVEDLLTSGNWVMDWGDKPVPMITVNNWNIDDLSKYDQKCNLEFINLEEEPVPKVGDILNYYDDGKVTLGRQLKAVVTKVVPRNEFTLGLYNRWRYEQYKNPFIFDDRTDYIIYVDLYLYNGKINNCEFNGDLTTVKLARSHDGWYAFTNWWSGRLDVTGELTEELKESYKNYKYSEDPTVDQVKEWLKQ